jgi:hypothetical protein
MKEQGYGENNYFTGSYPLAGDGHIHVYVRGWMNYFGIGMRYTDIMELDHWLRRRMRMWSPARGYPEAVGPGAKTDW